MTDPTKERPYPRDKKRLFAVADGPEAIEIYTSEDQAMVDMASDCPALYMQIALNGAQMILGPFQLKAIREAVERALAANRF